jgi:hypothetical protein
MFVPLVAGVGAVAVEVDAAADGDGGVEVTVDGGGGGVTRFEDGAVGGGVVELPEEAADAITTIRVPF